MTIKLSGVRQVAIAGDYIKLDALLKYASIASTGGEAKMIIQSGDVFVSGQVCLQRGKKIRSGDVIKIGRGILIVRQDENK